MPKKVSVNSKSKSQDIKEAAKAAAREAYLEIQREEDEGPDDSLFEQLDHSNQIEAESSNNASSNMELDSFDLFDFCDDLTRKGVLVQYAIKKNNTLIASAVSHPLSWDVIMKKYGEGLYQIIAKNVATKKFIKSQTQLLGSQSGLDDIEENEKEESQSNFGIVEMMTLLEKKSLEAKREAREEALRIAELQEKQQNQMLTLVTAMVGSQKQGPSSAEIQLQTMTMMSTMLEKMQNNTNQMIEKLTNRIEKIAEDSTKKKEDGPSWDMVMKMQLEAQQKGFDMWNKLNELAEAKAEERVNLIEEYRGDDDDKEEKKESATDSLIKAVLPTVVSALAGQPRQVVAQPQQPSPQQIAHHREMQRRQALENQARSREALRNEAQKKDAEKIKEEIFAAPVVTGLPKVDFSEDSVSESEEVRTACLEILPAFLGQLMVEASSGGVSDTQAAEATLRFLTEHGISRDEFISSVKSQDLIEVAEGYNLPEEAKVWLNELYANIKTNNRTEARGELTANI